MPLFHHSSFSNPATRIFPQKVSTKKKKTQNTFRTLVLRKATLQFYSCVKETKQKHKDISLIDLEPTFFSLFSL